MAAVEIPQEKKLRSTFADFLGRQITLLYTLYTRSSRPTWSRGLNFQSCRRELSLLLQKSLCGFGTSHLLALLLLLLCSFFELWEENLTLPRDSSSHITTTATATSENGAGKRRRKALNIHLSVLYLSFASSAIIAAAAAYT